MTSRVFLLSPAHCGGSRAAQLLAPGAQSPLSARLHEPGGASLGDVFAFVSGLYFRGKLAYARRFAAPPRGRGVTGIHIITTNAGLLPPEHRISAGDLVTFRSHEISADSAAFTEPLVRSARALDGAAGPACDVVLLGSIATPKYVDALVEVFGDRLRFPIAFVGRGDMSRGGLLLRQAADRVELDYAPVRGTTRRGPRPPRLTPLHRDAASRGRR